MSSEVEIRRLVGTMPPTFDAEWNGQPLVITLDSSAVLKLEGDGSYRELPKVLPTKSKDIARAARRLIEQRHFQRLGEMRVVISALDFD